MPRRLALAVRIDGEELGIVLSRFSRSLYSMQSDKASAWMGTTILTQCSLVRKSNRMLATAYRIDSLASILNEIIITITTLNKTYQFVIQ